MGTFWLVILGISIVAANRPPNSTDCSDICSKCGEKQNEKRHCLALCPTLEYPYNLCRQTSKYSEAVIGISVGIVLFLIIVMSGLLCIRLRKNKKDRIPKQNPKELKKFHRDLERLRPHSYTFLAILNDIRRHVREMYRAGNTDAAIICGRSLSDLAKILMLLNRRDLPVVPPDWPRLCSWAERLLERTSIASPSAQAPVGQLIQFFQPPSPMTREIPDGQSTAMSTLKPPSYEDSIPLQDRSNFDHFQFGKTEWTQHWEFPQEMAGDSGRVSQEDAWQSRTPVVQNNLWIDDDFFTMAFRPQDEIVTVL